ncbi:MAG TPA: hypothetical protein VGN19_09455 [Pedococcus sp.]|jgi:hypothetical protein|nr:hypothetical protein [Pedococcus sp.]
MTSIAPGGDHDTRLVGDEYVDRLDSSARVCREETAAMTADEADCLLVALEEPKQSTRTRVVRCAREP